MNDLVKFGGGKLPANPSDLAKGLQNVNSHMQSSGGNLLLRLKKTGIYAYGPENIEPEEGSHWAINPYSIEHGWACWVDSELLGEQMVAFNQQLPPVAELPDYGGPWAQQFSMQLQCLDGEDKGITVTWKGTSTGLRNAAKKLINEIIAQVQADPNHVVPVVELESDSYQHKKYGEIFFPVIDPIDWISIQTGESDKPESGENATEDEVESAPPKKSRSRKKQTKSKDADSEDVDATSTGGEDDSASSSNRRSSRRRRRRAAE